MFDNLAALAPPTLADLWDKLDCYLSTDVEKVEDVIRWWVEHRGHIHDFHEWPWII